MRIAVKYSMDDIQAAIAKVIPLIPLQPQHDLGKAILRLAFVAEFSNHFFKNEAIQLFTQASSINYQPTVDQLEPLLPYPAFVVLMMEYREGLRNQATSPWNRRWGAHQPAESNWLGEEFERFGFKPRI